MGVKGCARWQEREWRGGRTHTCVVLFFSSFSCSGVSANRNFRIIEGHWGVCWGCGSAPAKRGAQAGLDAMAPWRVTEAQHVPVRSSLRSFPQRLSCVRPPRSWAMPGVLWGVCKGSWWASGSRRKRILSSQRQPHQQRLAKAKMRNLRASRDRITATALTGSRIRSREPSSHAALGASRPALPIAPPCTQDAGYHTALNG